MQKTSDYRETWGPASPMPMCEEGRHFSRAVLVLRLNGLRNTCCWPEYAIDSVSGEMGWIGSHQEDVIAWMDIQQHPKFDEIQQKCDDAYTKEFGNDK